jgi:DNA polymerase-3 subunit alpha
MGSITEVGLLKMDFLGLRNLTVIHDAVGHIRRSRPDFDIHQVPLDDQATFDLLNRGDTMGVFQLESSGMVATCRKYQLQKIDDIIDLLALYRPGAMDYIDDMIEVKKGRKKAVYEHPLLEKVCADTYGVMIYQEQVQNAAKLLAGYTLGGADLLRRAMGKKDEKKMAEERDKFVAGSAATNGIGPVLANQIFKKIEMFAGYGFNKSHSACYGHISYWTAYLKANFPVEFMSALLSNEIQNTDKISVFVVECHRMGIDILPPDLNRSQLRFAPEPGSSGRAAIRYGLAGIKNCGEGAMAIAVAEREAAGPFTSLEDFSTRLDSKVINKRILETLVKAGALDWTGETRAAMFERIETVISAAASVQRDRASGQVSLFDAMDFAPAPPSKPAAKGRAAKAAEDWSKDERLAHEKLLLGFYVTGHPLDKFRKAIGSERYRRLGLLEDLSPASPRERFPFAGMIRSVEAKTTKGGKPFCNLVLEDFTGSAEITLWSEEFLPARDAGLLESGRIVRLKCSVQTDDRTGTPRLSGYGIEELKHKRALANGKGPLELTLMTHRHSERDLDDIHFIIAGYPGHTPVHIHFQNSAGRRVTVELGTAFNVKRSVELEDELARWIEE